MKFFLVLHGYSLVIANVNGLSIIPRLVAILAGDRGVRACVDLPQVVEGIPLGNTV